MAMPDTELQQAAWPERLRSMGGTIGKATASNQHAQLDGGIDHGRRDPVQPKFLLS